MPCYIEKAKDGGSLFICGDLGAHCRDCAALGLFLCDYPVGEGKTCDAPLCADHATEVAPEVHYCNGHLTEWEIFRERGGVEQSLRNVFPFKR